MTEINQEAGLLRRASEGLRRHVVDSASIMSESNPIYAMAEVGLSGLPYEASLNSRIICTAMTFAGVGWAYGKGRDLWRKRFQITDRTRELVQTLHDGLYASAINIGLMPAIYLASGVTDPLEIATGTTWAAGIGLLNGVPLGYAVDLGRDLTGVEESARIPRFIRERSPTVKKTLAAILAAGSVGLTSLVYKNFV